MKKKTLLACGAAALSFCVSNNAMAQWLKNATNTIIYTDPLGAKVGINITNPDDQLTVNGNIGMSTLLNDFRFFRGRSNVATVFYGNGDFGNGAGISLNSKDNGGAVQMIHAPLKTAGNASGEDGFLFQGLFGSDYITHMQIRKDGNVGIGSTGKSSIQDKLTVNGTIGFEQSSTFRGILGRSNTAGMCLYSNTTWADGSGIMLNGSGGTGPDAGQIVYVSHGVGGSGVSHAFVSWDPAPPAPQTPTWKNRMIIDKEGRVIIGEHAWAPNNYYKLFVETGILTESIKVATISGGNWSDFVFADDYKLRDLNEVEDFIKENKHLPEIPSAKEVEKEGLDLAQMDAKLLQKVEELTLYVIQQQKEIESLKKKLNK